MLVFEWSPDSPVVDIVHDHAEVLNPHTESLHKSIGSEEQDETPQTTNNIDNTTNNEQQPDAIEVNEEENSESESLPIDPQEHSIDGFFDEEPTEGNDKGNKGSASFLHDTNITAMDVDEIHQIEECTTAEEASTGRESMLALNKNNADGQNPILEQEQATDNATNPRRSNRGNKGQIERMVMDYRGKDYRSY